MRGHWRAYRMGDMYIRRTGLRISPSLLAQFHWSPGPQGREDYYLAHPISRETGRDTPVLLPKLGPHLQLYAPSSEEVWRSGPHGSTVSTT
jgi:hypothetical protein